MQTVVDWLKHWRKRWWLYLTLISALILIIFHRSVVNLIRPGWGWVEDPWTDLQPGDRGTWVGGLATTAAVIVTLIIAVGTALHQRSRFKKEERELKKKDQKLVEEKQRLQAEQQEAAKRAHAEKISCWVAGRIKSYDGDLGVQTTGLGRLVVALTNASEQPFTEAAVEVELKEPQGSNSIRGFKISVVPPGMSWFAFDSNGGRPVTLLLPIWFLDKDVRSWTRTHTGRLKQITKEERWDKHRDATYMSLHHGNPVESPGLNDAWDTVPSMVTADAPA